jgi:hypothetical protein
MLELRDGTRTNSQLRVQDDMNWHNQEKIGWLMQVEWKWCSEFSRENFEHKLYMTCNLWEEAPFPSLLYSMPFHENYIQCHFSPRLPSGAIIGFIPCTFPHLWVCLTPKHILLASWAFGFTLNHEPNVRVHKKKKLDL